MSLGAQQRVYHVALRMPETIKVQGEELDVIARHNEVASDRGKVAFGKLGSKLATGKLVNIRSQVGKGWTNRLFVLHRSCGFLNVYSAPIIDIVLSQQEVDEKIIPSYYKYLTVTPGSYFIIGMFVPDDIHGMRLASTSRELERTLIATRTTMMVVYRCGQSPDK